MANLGQYKQQFQDVVAKSVDDQAAFFLRAFVLEFQGKFEEVLELGTQFKKYLPESGQELEEDMLHRFLEVRGETKTVVEFRDALKKMDIDQNRKTAFIEFCMWKYNKGLGELFAPAGKNVTKELLEALERAIAAYQEVQRKKEAREKEIARLQAIVDGNPGGVKGMAAKNQIEQMLHEDELERNRQEVTTAAKKRAAEKAVEKGAGPADDKEKEKALKKETERLRVDQLKKEEDEKNVRNASRQRLSKRAELWNQPGADQQ
jgi:hypothetical protein